MSSRDARMKLLVTGASGFLGRAVVDAALLRGFDVRAQIRKTSSTPTAARSSQRLEIIRLDLRDASRIDAALADIDLVIHLAAAKSGSLDEQMAATVVATENLLAAMNRVGLRRIVLASSFSVYDYRKIPAGSILDEQSPIEADFDQRDAYCRTKVLQETLVRERIQQVNGQAVILRPGMILGPDHLFSDRLGRELSPDRWLLIGGGARLPLTYVENCADAFVRAAELSLDGVEIFNIVDDETPTQAEYVSCLQTHWPTLRTRTLPWGLARSAATTALFVNRRFFGGSFKLPGVLIPARLMAMCKPLRFGNGAAKDRLGWLPRFGLHEAVARSSGQQQA